MLSFDDICASKSRPRASGTLGGILLANGVSAGEASGGDMYSVDEEISVVMDTIESFRPPNSKPGDRL